MFFLIINIFFWNKNAIKYHEEQILSFSFKNGKSSIKFNISPEPNKQCPKIQNQISYLI